MVKIIVQPDLVQWEETAAGRIANIIQATLQLNPRFSLALAGGTTPRSVYERLAQTPYVRELVWERVHIFWGDERCVPSEHPESNYRMAHEALLHAIPGAHVHRMAGELDPLEAATHYERHLRDFFAGEDETFDLTLLGMGEDGHTASLFPGTSVVHERERWVTALTVDTVPPQRLTLTPAVFNRSSNIMFLVTGEKKAATVKQVIEGMYQPEVYPAQIITPASGETTWLLDAAAARHLKAE